MMKAKFLIPFAIFVVLAGFLFKGLYLDPRALPSVLINKPLPALNCRRSLIRLINSAPKR